MNISMESIDEVNAVIKLNIEKADYENTVEETLNDYRKKANIPGFRPGKVPVSLIRKQYGRAIIAEEVNKLIFQNLSKYIADEKLQLLGEPLPNTEKQKTIDWDKDENFEFVFDIGLTPEINVTLDKRKKLDYFKITVADDLIDKQIEAYTKGFGANKPIDEIVENATVRGDFIQLDDQKKELEDGIKPAGVLLGVDTIKEEEIKKLFIGKKKEDVIIFDPVKAFEDRHEVGHMLNISHEEAEKLDSEFKFTVREINLFESAEVNEGLYKKVFGEETEISNMDEFRDKVKNELSINLSYSSDHKFTLDAIDYLVEKTSMELPEAFLKRWLMETNKELNEEQIDKDFDKFMKDLRWQIIRNIIIKENEISVSEEDALELAKEITFAQFNQYGMYSVPEEQLESFAKKMLEKKEERDRINNKLYETKVISVVKEKINLNEIEVSQEEFTEKMK